MLMSFTDASFQTTGRSLKPSSRHAMGRFPIFLFIIMGIMYYYKLYLLYLLYINNVRRHAILNVEPQPQTERPSRHLLYVIIYYKL